MKNDEFNYTKISNEKDGFSSIEYGKIQKVEFTFTDDNKTKIKDELNDNPNENIANKKEVEKTKELESKDVDSQIKNDLITSTTSSTAASTSASASSASGFIASATAVTVGTVSTLVGINVLMSTKCYINNIETTPISINYDVEINDKNDDIVVINLENKDNNFLETKELAEGQNVDYFDNLIPSCKYTLTVVDQKYNNVLYTEEVTTDKQDIKDIASISVNIDNNIKYSIDYFDVKLSFSGDSDNINNIQLHLINSSNRKKAYDLEKTLETQHIKLNRNNDIFYFDFRDTKGYDYYLTYKYKDEEVSLDRKHIKFRVEQQPVNNEDGEDKLNSFYLYYWNTNDDYLYLKYDMSNSHKTYSNPHVSFVAIDAYDTEEEEEEERDRFDFTGLSINNGLTTRSIKMTNIKNNIDKLYYYYFYCYDNTKEEDVLLASGIVDFNKMQNQIHFSRKATSFYEKNGNIYLPLHFEYYNHSSVYKSLSASPLKYIYEGDSTPTLDYIDSLSIKNGTSVIKLTENKSNNRDTLIIDSLMINNKIQKDNTDTVYNYNTDNDPDKYHTLTRLTNSEILGGYINSLLIDRDNPSIPLHLVYNDMDTISDAKVIISVPEEDEDSQIFEFPFVVNDLLNNNNTVNLDLTTYGDDIYNLLKSSPISISVSYKREVEEELETVIEEKECLIYDSIILNYYN